MNNIVLDPEATFEELFAAAQKKFGEIEFSPVRVGDREMELAQLADMPAYLDKMVEKARGGKKIELPLWAKIWPSCLVLGFYILKCKDVPGAKLLDIGAGGGLCGILAAGRGFDVVLADVDDDALLFTRLNVLRNNFSDKIKVRKVDFSVTDLGEKFNYIAGCEVLQHRSVQKSLQVFFEKHISGDKNSEVLLAMDKKLSNKVFFDDVKDKYHLMKQDVPFSGNTGEGQSVVSLIRMGGQV